MAEGEDQTASDLERIALQAVYGTLRRENAYQGNRNPKFPTALAANFLRIIVDLSWDAPVFGA